MSSETALVVAWLRAEAKRIERLMQDDIGVTDPRISALILAESYANAIERGDHLSHPPAQPVARDGEAWTEKQALDFLVECADPTDFGYGAEIRRAIRALQKLAALSSTQAANPAGGAE